VQALAVGQGLGLDQVQLDGVVGLALAAAVQAAAGFGGAIAVEQDLGLAQLGRQVVVAGTDQAVFDQRALLIAALLVEAAQVEMGGIDVGIARHQFFQVDGGLIPGLGLQGDQRQRVAKVVVVGELLDQAGELAPGVVQAAQFDQLAGVGQAYTLVVGVALDA